ncbi:MAG: hypothetical protein OEV08_04045 [Nitrospira sp.]|nr:hypothetical protein [Nitrospira sp.]
MRLTTIESTRDYVCAYGCCREVAVCAGLRHIEAVVSPLIPSLAG